jgi:hypothetical protein
MGEQQNAKNRSGGERVLWCGDGKARDLLVMSRGLEVVD